MSTNQIMASEVGEVLGGHFPGAVHAAFVALVEFRALGEHHPAEGVQVGLVKTVSTEV